MKKTLLVLLACAVLSGCATVGHLETPTGRPEVFIENATSKDVINKCVGLLVSSGWQTEQANDYMLQAVIHSNNPAADFLLGSELSNYQTWYRIVINFVQESGGVRVYAVQKLVSNKGTGFESAIDLQGQKAYENTQSILESLRREYIPTCPVQI